MKLIPKEKIQKILIIRPDMIGDVVLVTPAISAIKKNYPKCKISIIIKEYTRGIVEGDPNIDEIIIDNGKSLFQYVKEIKAKKFDIGITYLNKGFYALLMLLAGIPVRIGDKSKILHGWMYNFGVYQHWRDYTRHEVEQNMELIKPLGIIEPDPKIKVFVDQGAEASIKTKLTKKGISDPDFVIGIHPGTGGGNKPFLPEDYAKAIDKICSRHKVKIIITGGKNEEAAGQKIYELTTNKPVLMINETTLPEFVALIKRFNLYIGVDTGPFHIAAGFGVPIAALFTTKMVKPTKWGPWGTRHIILHNPYSCKIQCFPRKCDLTICQEAIDSDDLLKAVEELMNGKGNSSHEEAFSSWIKNSLNILLVGRSNEKDILYNDLRSTGYSVISLDETPSIPALIDIYRSEDINIVHLAGIFGNIRLLLSCLLSSLFLPIPVLLIKNKSLVKAKNAINHYINTFRGSIL